MKFLSTISICFLTIISCNNNSASENINTSTPTQQANFQIIKQYPHNSTSFTEGLEYRDSSLYESTGLNGTSK